MRNVVIAGMTGRGVQISTDLSAIERRVGLACAVAKLNRGDSRKKTTSQRKWYYCETSDFASVLSERSVVLSSGLV